MAPPFHPWSAQHILITAATVILPIVTGFWARRDPSGWRARIIAWLLAVLLVGQLLANFFLVALKLRLGWAEYMPLQACHLALFATVGVCVARNTCCYDLAYFWGLAGTLQGVLTPGLQSGFPALECVLFFLGHSGIVAGVIFVTIAFRLRPRWTSVLRAYVSILGYAIIAGTFNAASDTNYGFLCEKPATASLFNWLGPWPWYIANAALLGAALFVLLYLPWALADAKRRAGDSAQE